MAQLFSHEDISAPPCDVTQYLPAAARPSITTSTMAAKTGQLGSPIAFSYSSNGEKSKHCLIEGISEEEREEALRRLNRCMIREALRIFLNAGTFPQQRKGRTNLRALQRVGQETRNEGDRLMAKNRRDRTGHEVPAGH